MPAFDADPTVEDIGGALPAQAVCSYAV